MYIVIVNSYAGQRHYNKILKQIKKRLHKPFVPYFTSEFQEDFMWKEINNEICKKKEYISGILVVGGDGTLHHTIQQLNHHQLPIGLIASGSGNDFGRALKIPKNINKAIKRIQSNKPEFYDLLKVNGRTVLSIIGIGVDAVTAIKCQDSRIKKVLNKALLGRLAYLTVFFQTVFHYKPLSIVVTNEQKQEYSFHKVWLLACGNTSYYGGGVPICPKADPQDGKINLVVVHNLNVIQLLMALPTVFIKKHLSLPYVTELNGEKFHIEAIQGVAPVQGDGEEIGETAVEIHIEKNAMKFY